MILHHMVTPSPPDTQKNIFMHFWMNWDIFDDFQFKCLNFIFFSKSLRIQGGERAIRQIKLAWPKDKILYFIDNSNTNYPIDRVVVLFVMKFCNYERYKFQNQFNSLRRGSLEGQMQPTISQKTITEDNFSRSDYIIT